MTEAPVIDSSIEVTMQLDDGPDLSWLDQKDKDIGEGFEAHAQERKDSYCSTWWMVGVVVKGSTPCSCREASRKAEVSLWGIESDSGDKYFHEIAEELIAEVREELGLIKGQEAYISYAPPWLEYAGIPEAREVG